MPTPADPAPAAPAEPGSRRTATVLVVAFCLFALLASIAVRVVMNVLSDRYADDHAAACAALDAWLGSERRPEDLVTLRAVIEDKWQDVYALDADGDLVVDDQGVRRTLAEECA